MIFCLEKRARPESRAFGQLGANELRSTPRMALNGIHVAGCLRFAELQSHGSIGLLVSRGLQPRDGLLMLSLSGLGMVARPEKGRRDVYQSATSSADDLKCGRHLCLRCAG
jgi:hypothetical protein